MGEKRYACRFLVERSGRRIPLGITRHRNEYNIKMQLRQILWIVWSGSSNIIRMIKSRRMRWAGHVTRMGAMRNAYRVLVGMPEGKRPLGRPRCRWVDDIKIDLREIGWALVNKVMNLRVP
jgi:hypothetical protein